MQGFRDNLVRMYGEANARANSQSLVGALGEIIDTRGGNLALGRAGEITCPVLLITGEHDMFAPPALLAQLAAGLRTVETQVVPGAPHDVHNTAPEWTAETLLAWLGRH
jgi:pimeloyl-ACP methyl ester carboxylesterase